MVTTAPYIPSTARERRRRRRVKGSALVKYAFLLPAVLYMVLFFGYPIVQNFIMSFQNYTSTTYVTGEAPWVGLENYAAIFDDPLFFTALINTVLFALGSLAGQFVIGLSLALFFRKRFPLSGVLRSLILIPWLIPMIVASAVWRWILELDNGALNQFLGGLGVIAEPIPWLTSPELALLSLIIVNIWIGIPFNMVLLHSGLQGIPEDLYEAAQLDGATGWRSFAYITVPLLRPVMGVVLLLGVIYTLKVIDLILGLTGGGPANSTHTIATRSYELSFVQFDFGQGAALGNILIVMALAFAVAYLWSNARASKEQ